MQTARPNHGTQARCCYGRAAFFAVSLALRLPCLAPPGYMAGSLDDGWPVVLCPEGLPAGFLGHDAHHHHEDAAGEDVSLDGYCALGSILDASAELQALNLTTDRVRFAVPGILYHSATAARRPEAHPARAPPTHV